MGGGVYRDGVSSDLSKSRADKCVEIFYRLDNIPKTITIGEASDRIGTSEGEQIKKLIENGINNSLIYAEADATSTIENIDFAFDFINKECENDDISIMIIIHIKRTVYIALKKMRKNHRCIFKYTCNLQVEFLFTRSFCMVKIDF